jgi:uncharacterized protein YchJ
MVANNILDISRLLSSKCCCVSGLRYPNSTVKYNIERTSEAEPDAIFRKRMYSFLLLRSYPSAILLETETAARQIWSLNP